MPTKQILTEHTDGTVTDLLTGVAGDARDLAVAHAEQLRTELQDEVQRVRSAAHWWVIGIGSLALGTAFALVAAAMFLHEQYGWSMWAASAAVGGTIILIGATTFAYGRWLWDQVTPWPRRTIRSIQETWKCLKNSRH
ncbi:MAG: phage holin family protein [Gemmataceae bacterium]